MLLKLENRALMRLCGLSAPKRHCCSPSKGAVLSRPPPAGRSPATLGRCQRRRLHDCLAAAAASTATPRAQQDEAGQLPPAEQQQQQPHVSVLLEEVMGFFRDLNISAYVDGTLGAAGHAGEVLYRHPELQTLVGFDLDTTAHDIAAARLEKLGARVVPLLPKAGPRGSLSLSSSEGLLTLTDLRVASSAQPDCQHQPPQQQQQQGQQQPTAYIVHSNFGGLGRVLGQLEGGRLMGAVDAVLLDLGMSSMQVDQSDRGFSFLRDGPLDMRMDASGTASGTASRSAEELVNYASEQELGIIFREFGEERYWKSIARRIVSGREEEPITTTQQLVRVIGNPGGFSRGSRRGDAKQKHPATRVFQALRIAVNDELRSVAQVLPDAIQCLRPGGRLAVITFHSLEDRIVKWAFRQAAGMAPSDGALPSYCAPFEQTLEQPLVKILTRRPVLPSEEEQQANSRSRSAKLRVVERL
ncbi:hypothetical protein N2152v2_005622 [Parachlorella kessleri]